VLNRNHNFPFFDAEKLFESVKFKPVLFLLVNIKSLKNGTTVIFEAEPNVFTESVLSIIEKLSIIRIY